MLPAACGVQEARWWLLDLHCVTRAMQECNLMARYLHAFHVVTCKTPMSLSTTTVHVVLWHFKVQGNDEVYCSEQFRKSASQHEVFAFALCGMTF